MKEVKMTIELLSDNLSGSGEGFGAVIDTDVQYDELGIPFISSKRIKGALRNSLYDFLEMPVIKQQLNIKSDADREVILDSVFGKVGSVQPSSFKLSNFYIADYENIKKWFMYLIKRYPDIYSREKILSTFTNIRRQTRIDENGIAKKHSLRTARVVNKGLRLQANLTYDEKDENLIALACANLRRIGTMRNRGLGEIMCYLDEVDIPGIIDGLKDSSEVK